MTESARESQARMDDALLSPAGQMAEPIEGWHRGDWMQTFTGRKFYPMAPKPEDVDPLDIAHALSNLCRYAGHVDRFYSVAEHCVLMSHWLAFQGAEPLVQLEALLHDATEAYVVDVPRPLKINLPDYQAAEAKVAVAIALRFGHQAITFGGGQDRVVESVLVRDADTRILLDERAALMKAPPEAWGIDELEPLGVLVRGWEPRAAESAYLNRLVELGVRLTGDAA